MPRSGILISLVLLDIQVNGAGGLAINIPKLAVGARPQEIGHAVALDAVVEGQGAERSRNPDRNRSVSPKLMTA